MSLLMLVALASAGFLSGCTSATAGLPDAGVLTPSAAPAPAPTGTPTPSPSLDPSRPAKDNLAYFDATVRRVLAHDPASSGASVLDALAAAGFNRADMEVTPERTAAGLEADSVVFSVRFNRQCLIGQLGPDDNGYHSMVAPLLGTGRCLLGPTAK